MKLRLSTSILIALALAGCTLVPSPVSAPSAGNELTRAQFVAQVSDYFGWYHASGYNDYWKVPLRTFADVKAEDPYGKQIENAYEENVISPDARGRFNPTARMTREDAAVIFAKAYFLPMPSDTRALNAFGDAGAISDAAKPSVAALVAAGFMPGRTRSTFAPAAAITAAEAQAVFRAVAAKSAVVVQAMPKQAAAHLTLLPEGAGSSGAAGRVDDATFQRLLADRNYAPRRFIHLTSPTPGATIYYTTDGTDPRTSLTRVPYDVTATGHIQELVGERSGAKGPQPYRLVTWKTVAVKNGVAVSPVRTFRWNLVRPWQSVYGADVVEPGNFDPARGPVTPKVTRLYSDAESVRSMAWLIEGPQSAVVFDALQTPWNSTDQLGGTLYDKVRTLTSKPLKLVIGHAHGDHIAQAQNFLDAGVPVYANHRSWAGLAAVLATKDHIRQVRNVQEGDQFDLGTDAMPLKFDVWTPPGHENSLVMIHDKVSGFLFSTDFYGCTRMGTADNVGITGARADLLLSLLMQAKAGYMSNGGRLTRLFTGHDEAGLPGEHVDMFHQLLQNVVDQQEAANSPTLRSSDAPRARTTITGNMFTDLYDWAAINLGGVFGTTPYTYLSAPNAAASSHSTIDFTQPNAHLKYAVLGNIELTGATLVGTTVTWAAPNPQVTLSDGSLWPATGPVPNSLTNKFNPFVFAYTVKVPAGATRIGVTPIPLASKARRVTVNGADALPRTPVSVAVANGAAITIVVTAPDGVTTETYRLTVATE
ncbi:MAG: S-layer homology domain-containing protein [Gammaproteobacteria bacterium]|nr:S-layer homology domain-containing protein [Gammaproteobacteria bacterium]